jgi:uncharacterized protein YkwD
VAANERRQTVDVVDEGRRASKMNRRSSIFVALALGASVALALAVSPNARAGDRLLAPEHFCPNPALSAPVQAQIDAMLCYHRYARRQTGVPVLRTVAPLHRSAALKARWIFACGRFTHSPCGHSLTSVLGKVDYSRGSWSIGENLGWGSGSLARVRTMFTAWLNSPEHRLNIVRPSFREIGLARVHVIHLFGYDDVTLWVAHFGSH